MMEALQDISLTSTTGCPDVDQQYFLMLKCRCSCHIFDLQVASLLTDDLTEHLPDV